MKYLIALLSAFSLSALATPDDMRISQEIIQKLSLIAPLECKTTTQTPYSYRLTCLDLNDQEEVVVNVTLGQSSVPDPSHIFSTNAEVVAYFPRPLLTEEVRKYAQAVSAAALAWYNSLPSEGTATWNGTMAETGDSAYWPYSGVSFFAPRYNNPSWSTYTGFTEVGFGGNMLFVMVGFAG